MLEITVSVALVTADIVGGVMRPPILGITARGMDVRDLELLADLADGLVVGSGGTDDGVVFTSKLKTKRNVCWTDI